MKQVMIGFGIACFSASLGALAFAFRSKPLPLGPNEKIIDSAQWARLRRRAAAERRAAPPPRRRGLQAPHGPLN